MLKRLILISLIVILSGCATVKIDLPDQWGGILALCRGATFVVLQNNPKYIPEVEPLLNVAIERANSPTVDAVALLQEIQGACAGFQVKLPKEAAMIAVILGEVKILIENGSNRVTKLQSLLAGIKQGVELAKGGK